MYGFVDYAAARNCTLFFSRMCTLGRVLLKILVWVRELRGLARMLKRRPGRSDPSVERVSKNFTKAARARHALVRAA
jgi:hypothetical protein